MNFVKLVSVLFIFSELIVCRINLQKFTVAKLALCRRPVNFVASILLWYNLYNSILI